MPNGDRANTSSGGHTFLTLLIVVAVIYFARMVLIPLALSVLVAFMLAPCVSWFRHKGLGRLSSGIIVIITSFLIVAVVTTLMAVQMADLAQRLPEYQQNVRTKLETIRTSGGGLVSRISRIGYEVAEGFMPAAPIPSNHRPGEQQPVPVEIRQAPFSPLAIVQKLLGSVVNVALVGGIVVVFVMFILIQREDLRDRIIRLAGSKQIHLTTTVLDDAAARVSRFLLAQLVLNSGYGLLAAVGLYFIGVPNPMLWGILAALLRYIPYLGIWVAAIMPAAVAFAVEPGWSDVLLVFALYCGLDLFLYNLGEPLLYGTSTGLSPLAVLVAAVFWTWLWGPVGLLLATPLTVCVVVLGRHVRPLEFLSVLLSDDPVLSPATRFYQRLLARDLDEAAEIVQQYHRGRSLEEVYDNVVIPALSLAEEDRHVGKLDDTRQRFILENTRLLLEDLGARSEGIAAGVESGKPRLNLKTDADLEAMSGLKGSWVICLPARDEADELAALMLAQLLAKRGFAAQVLPGGALASEAVEVIQRLKPAIACVLSVPPFGYMYTRYLCRRLRGQFPELKILSAILTERDIAELKQRQPPLEVDELATSLKQMVDQLICVLPTRTEISGTPAVVPAATALHT